MTHIEILTKHKACADAMEFAKQYESMSDTIENCERWDWLRWALRLIADKRVRVGVAAHIVRNTPLNDGRTVYDLLTNERSRNAIAVCERYAKGHASDEELKDAYADAAYAAYAAAAAYADAAYAAYAAACAAAAAYADAAYAADAAAYAAAYAAADAAAYAAAKKFQMGYIKSLDWDVIIQPKEEPQ